MGMCQCNDKDRESGNLNTGANVQLKFEMEEDDTRDNFYVSRARVKIKESGAVGGLYEKPAEINVVVEEETPRHVEDTPRSKY
jgi:hypothetical protein